MSYNYPKTAPGIPNNEASDGKHHQPPPYNVGHHGFQHNVSVGMYPPPQPMPIINQPQGGSNVPAGWMAAPQHHINCPPGLEYLSTIDQLLVHQKVELLEVFTRFETQNKYTVKNSLGQKIYFAGEDSGCCSRNCCGPLRPFEMNIVDNHGNEVIHFHRPFACESCCCPCCLQNMEVSSPPGTVVGIVEQKWSILFPDFAIKNASGDVILRIKGPFCTQSCCCGDVVFDVLLPNGEKVGKIYKQWSGIVKETFTDADNFGISFPMDLDVRVKATLLGALFLIDFMFFERTREKRDRPGMLN